jgi:hypothetical protein
MQVAVSPSHYNLKNIAQAIEIDTAGHLNTPPNGRIAATQRTEDEWVFDPGKNEVAGEPFASLFLDSNSDFHLSQSPPISAMT